MKRKVLFITHRLQSYRVPILEMVATNPRIELTVLHSGEPLLADSRNITERVIPMKKYGKFLTFNESIVGICRQFDIAVCMAYIQNFSLMRLLFERNRNFKLIFWGIGVNASQTTEFDSPSWKNLARYLVAKYSDASIFYSDYAKQKYTDNGIPSEKLFVMNNTVEVLPVDFSQDFVEREYILFFGTLNKSKRIISLLNAFRKAKEMHDSIPRLVIVGKGPDLESAKRWVTENELAEFVEFRGPIYDEVIIRDLFRRARVCVSPGQAGLSVLKSFGYGVPFVTYKNAITGGERLNIDDTRGVLFDRYEDLAEILIDVTLRPEHYEKLGKNALSYYLSCRTPEMMARGFLDAIEYVAGVDL